MHCNLKARIKLFRLLLQSFSTSLWFAELMVEMKGYKVAALVFKYLFTAAGVGVVEGEKQAWS